MRCVCMSQLVLFIACSVYGDRRDTDLCPLSLSGLMVNASWNNEAPQVKLELLRAV